VRPGVEQNEPAVEDPLVDEHTVVRAADGRNGTQLELRVGPDKVLLACELDVACPEGEPRLLEVQPIDGPNHGAHIPERRHQDERLRDLARILVQNLRLGQRAIRVPVREELVRDVLASERVHQCICRLMTCEHGSSSTRTGRPGRFGDTCRDDRRRQQTPQPLLHVLELLARHPGAEVRHRLFSFCPWIVTGGVRAGIS
jgi:hypothetical protein